LAAKSGVENFNINQVREMLGENLTMRESAEPKQVTHVVSSRLAAPAENRYRWVVKGMTFIG
jgi:hypothetical protein